MSLIAFFIFVFADPASASKCFKATTIAEYKADFPSVIKGKVVERRKSPEGSSFLIFIEVLETLKGPKLPKKLRVIEVHNAQPIVSKHTYRVGESYVFPIIMKPDAGTFEVILPEDGCPALPQIKELKN